MKLAPRIYQCCARRVESAKKTNLLKSNKEGRLVYYMDNSEHPLFPERKSMVCKAMGIDQVIDRISSKLKDLEKANLVDDCAQGTDTGIIDSVLIGNICQPHLNDLCRKTERHIDRKIRFLVLNQDEFNCLFPKVQNRPHQLL